MTADDFRRFLVWLSDMTTAAARADSLESVAAINQRQLMLWAQIDSAHQRIHEVDSVTIERYKETLAASEELHPGPFDGLKTSLPIIIPVIAALSIAAIN